MNAYIYMFLATLAYSFFPIFNAAGLDYSSPLTFILLCSVIGLAQSWLLAGNILKNNFDSFHQELRKLDLMTISMIVLSGVMANLGNIFFVLSLTLMSKAGAAIIIECWPVVAMMLSPLIIQKEWLKFSFLDVLMVCVSLLGIILISYGSLGYSPQQLIDTPEKLLSGDIYSYLGAILAFTGAFCFALSGVFRAQFVTLLPQDFGKEYLAEKDRGLKIMILSEAVCKIFYIPVALLGVALLETSFSSQIGPSLFPAFFCAFIIVIVNILYSYALVCTNSSRVNIVWYFAPLMAVIWLVLLGYSEINTLLIIGGAMIITTNLIIGIQTSYSERKQKRVNATHIPDQATKPL